jgi:formate/nitrite transporter FocA (FNT family)
MVMAFVIMILLAQLWLFTTTLDAMENKHSSPQIAIAALVCSFMGCAAVWALIRFFLRTESNA